MKSLANVNKLPVVMDCLPEEILKHGGIYFCQSLVTSLDYVGSRKMYLGTLKMPPRYSTITHASIV